MVKTKSSQIKLYEYEGFGGNSWDSRHLTNFFNYDKPYNFGVQVAKMFSSSDRFSEKVLTDLTMGVGNYHVIDRDIYCWTLPGDDEKILRITEFLEAGNARPGYGEQKFQIALDEGWLDRPDVVQLHDNEVVLNILGPGIQVGNSWYYEVEIQTDNPVDWVDPQWLAVGMEVTKISTTVGTEENYEAGTTQFGSQLELEAQIGAYAEKFEVSDKVIRKELSAKKRGEKGGKYTSGYSFDISKGDKIIKQGGFLTFAEAELLDRIEMDRERAMVFGKNSTKKDANGRVIKRTSAGFRQLAKDGHVMYHNGALTAQDLEDYFMSIFLRTKDENERKVIIDTGSGGARLFHQILSDEANSFLTLDTKFIQNYAGSVRPTDLQYGAQFTKYIALNGVEVELRVNKMKDNIKYCRRTHPESPIYPIDSFRMDIYDLGRSNASEAKGSSNMSMIVEEGVEAYAWISSMVDPRSGVVNDGSTVASLNKKAMCWREMSGSLCVWDTSRIGSIIYDPEV